MRNSVAFFGLARHLSLFLDFAPHHITEVCNMLLVLTRKVGEKIVIDNSITVEILAVDWRESAYWHHGSPQCSY